MITSFRVHLLVAWFTRVGRWGADGAATSADRDQTRLHRAAGPAPTVSDKVLCGDGTVDGSAGVFRRLFHRIRTRNDPLGNRLIDLRAGRRTDTLPEPAT